MTKKTLFLVGLLVGGNSCWQTTTTTLKIIEPIGMAACTREPQPSIITISGDGFQLPAGTITTAALNRINDPTGASPIKILASDVANIEEPKSLQITLPLDLAPGSYQVTLYFTAAGQPEDSPVMVSGAFRYSAKSTAVTSLVHSSTFSGPPAPNAIAVWHPDLKRSLDLAVLTKSGTSLDYYSDPRAGYSQLPNFSTLPVYTDSAVLSRNLIQVGATSLTGVSVSALAVGSTAEVNSKPQSVIKLFKNGAGLPETLVENNNTLSFPMQLIAAGHFTSDALMTQFLTLYKGPPGTGQLFVTHFISTRANRYLATFSDTLEPVVILTGNFNRDTYTDALLIAQEINMPAKKYAYLVSGGQLMVNTKPTSISKVSDVVASGDLNGDGLPDLVFGQSGGVSIYYNSTPLSAMIPTGSSVDVTTVSTPYTLAVADYNEDGANDIVFTASDGVHVLLNGGTAPGTQPAWPTFTNMPVFSAPAGWPQPVQSSVVDFAGDSRPDVVVAEASGQILFLENSCPPSRLTIDTSAIAR